MGAVMLLLTLLAPQFLAIRVAAPLLPEFCALPVSFASPLLTLALKPCGLSFSEFDNLSIMHFWTSLSLFGAESLFVFGARSFLVIVLFACPLRAGVIKTMPVRTRLRIEKTILFIDNLQIVSN